MCLNEVLSLIVSGCDCLCVCDCGCMSEMGMSMCPGSYDLACISVSEVVCLWLCFDDRVWLCIRGCWCSLQTLLMPFAPKEEGHYLSPSRSECSEAVCSQGQPPCLPHRCASECVRAGAEVRWGWGCMHMPGGSFACPRGSRTPRTQQTQIMSNPHTLG